MFYDGLRGSWRGNCRQVFGVNGDRRRQSTVWAAVAMKGQSTDWTVTVTDAVIKLRRAITVVCTCVPPNDPDGRQRHKANVLRGTRGF